jgi:hypothetical protein
MTRWIRRFRSPIRINAALFHDSAMIYSSAAEELFGDTILAERIGWDIS